jgi:hypothetical protein
MAPSGARASLRKARRHSIVIDGHGALANTSGYHQKRRASALVTVLIVIVMLTLGAYSFVEFMLIEANATQRASRLAQAQASAESGVDYLATLLSNREEVVTENLYHNPTRFGGVVMQENAIAGAQSRFTFVAPAEHDLNYSQVRFGAVDESGKLNVNAIPNFDLTDEQARGLLLPLPGMTEDIADAILDWVDADEEPRPYGAESDTYQSLSTPYDAGNRPIVSVEELLMVGGVTPELVYGEDKNRNGLLDPNEDDGELSPPFDNADGILELGWRAYLTGFSRESNLMIDGSPKIDVNQPLLTELYDEIEELYGEDIAQFVVAYRLYGAINVEPLEDTGVDDGTTTGSTRMDQALENLAEGVVEAAFSSEGTTTTRGGMDLSQPAATNIESLYELIDAEIEAEIEGVPETLTSPWNSSSGDLITSLPELFQNFSTSSVEYIDGRININQARFEVLVGIPGMPEELAQIIMSQRPIDEAGQPLPQMTEMQATTGWLLIQGFADVTTMRRLDRFITSRGDVYSVQVLGHYDVGGPVSRVEAIIDSTQTPAKVIFQRDISHLGPGYQVSELLGLQQ